MGAVSYGAGCPQRAPAVYHRLTEATIVDNVQKSILLTGERKLERILRGSR